MAVERRSGGKASKSRPSRAMRPRSGITNPAILRINVVLPHPDGPSRVISAPGGTVTRPGQVNVAFYCNRTVRTALDIQAFGVGEDLSS